MNFSNVLGITNTLFITVIAFGLGFVLGKDYTPIQERVDTAIERHIFNKSFYDKVEKDLRSTKVSYDQLIRESKCKAIITTKQCIEDNNILTIAEQLKSRLIIKSGELQ